MKQVAIVAVATLAALTTVTLDRAYGESGLAQIHQDFSRDPKWEGRNDVPDPAACRDVRQDFGFSMTSHAGGGAGEIGGRVSRSLRPAYFAKPLTPRTLNDRLRASGRFSVTQSDGGSGVLIGWFNHESRGWRTPNSLVFRIDGEENRFRVFFEYGTQTWQTGGGATFEGEYQTTKTPMHGADGTPHIWSLQYDPAGAGGDGEITFTLDGQAYRAALSKGHMAEGAVFDRFGIMNVQISGQAITPWVDDLVLDGERQDFSKDPGWEGRDNRVSYRNCAVRPWHDFGYRPTSFAGGQPGEVGGLIWRIESTRPQEALAYGTPVGELSLNQKLEASGKLCLRGAAADSAILVGWYNSLTAIGAPPPNFIGLFIEGPSRVGHYVRPITRDSEEHTVGLSSGPIIRPDGKVHEWSLLYTPAANGDGGRIAFMLGGQTLSMQLSKEMRKAGAVFDRFGFVSWHRGGHFVEVYFDDLIYTAGPAK